MHVNIDNIYIPEIEKSAMTYNVAASKAAQVCNSIRGQLTAGYHR